MTSGGQRTGTRRGRIAARLLGLASWVACHLPERLAIRLAELGGDLWYRAAPAKRHLARANLRKVVTWMAAEQTGDPSAWPASTDPVALDRLVHSAFRHYARNYLETMRAPTMGGAYVLDRTIIEDPAIVDAAFAEHGPVIFVGLHFGSLELPGFYLVERSGRPVTTPMETIDEPAIQAWFVRTRNVVGIRLVDLALARSELAGALERGEIAGLVADRDVSGSGVEVPFFGAPARVPAGPALLAVQSHVPAFVAGVWRTTPGRYRGQLERIDASSGGTRREQVTAFMAAEVATFERLISRAPDQWWAVFFPIWPERAAS